MLHRGRIEIEWKGAFEVCFRSESGWATSKVVFYEAEEALMFLIDSVSLPPQEVSKAMVEAMAGGRSAIEEVVSSAQQLQSIFRPRICVTNARLAS